MPDLYDDNGEFLDMTDDREPELPGPVFPEDLTQPEEF